MLTGSVRAVEAMTVACDGIPRRPGTPPKERLVDQLPPRTWRGRIHTSADSGRTARNTIRGCRCQAVRPSRDSRLCGCWGLGEWVRPTLTGLTTGHDVDHLGSRVVLDRPIAVHPGREGDARLGSEPHRCVIEHGEVAEHLDELAAARLRGPARHPFPARAAERESLAN